jgi:hypothetical protein
VWSPCWSDGRGAVDVVKVNGEAPRWSFGESDVNVTEVDDEAPRWSVGGGDSMQLKLILWWIIMESIRFPRETFDLLCIAKVVCKRVALQNKVNNFIEESYVVVSLVWLFARLVSLWPPSSSSFIFQRVKWGLVVVNPSRVCLREGAQFVTSLFVLLCFLEGEVWFGCGELLACMVYSKGA